MLFASISNELTFYLTRASSAFLRGFVRRLNKMDVLKICKFGHGFVSAGIGSLAGSPLLRSDNPAVRIGVAAILGGAASDATGGKFVNGAATAAIAAAVSEGLRAGMNGNHRQSSGYEWDDEAASTLVMDGASLEDPTVRSIVNAQKRNTSRQALFQSCSGGDSSACASLKIINQADLKHAYAFIEAHFPEITERIGGFFSQGSLEDIQFDYTREFWAARSGITSPTLGRITLTGGYNSRGDLVATLAHELLHSGDGYFGRFATQLQDLNGLGSHHLYIHSAGDNVQSLYEFLNPH